jgi:hydroxymethylpyrimidine/phosphomethylpyrimidine kinase
MDAEANQLETPDAFLKALGESLRAKEGVDTDLAAILTAHILKGAPAPNAIAQAKDAIVKLASERADPPKVEVVHG